MSLPGGLTITSVGTADQGGTVEIDADGLSLKYTPADGFEGIETFTYTIETSEDRTDTATVVVRVGTVSEAAWAAVLEGLSRRSTSEAAEPSTLNASAISDTRFSAIDRSYRPFAKAMVSARSFRGSLAGRQIVVQAADDLLNLSLATADAGRGMRSATNDAFEVLPLGSGGKIGLSDDLVEILATEFTTGLVVLQ
jgi:hypothetical protein